jgi:hypothetical protein
MKHQNARYSLLLWTWLLHNISGHIRDFLFPSCQNNLVVYKWVAAFVTEVIDICRSSNNSLFISAIWNKQFHKGAISRREKYTYILIDERLVTSIQDNVISLAILRNNGELNYIVTSVHSFFIHILTSGDIFRCWEFNCYVHPSWRRSL